MFKRNEGILDRIVRVALGTVLLPVGLIWWFSGWPGGAAGLVAAGLGMLGLLTGITGFCPLYVPFGFSTLEKENEFIAKCQSSMGDCCGEPSKSRPSSTKQGCRSCSPSVGKPQNQPE